MQTEQGIDDLPSQVDENKTLDFSGTLTGMNDRPIVGESVDLERKTDGQWSVVDSATTDEDGDVRIPAKVSETADWRLVYRGDAFRDQDSSESVHVEAHDPINERIVEQAEAQEGKPYSYGADGPDSFDCSGLTQYVHDQVGIDLPRTSDAQRDALSEVAKSDKQPGDLVFFHDSDGSVYHVGIYAGDNAIWHAAQEGEPVHHKELWTDDYTVGRAW